MSGLPPARRPAKNRKGGRARAAMVKARPDRGTISYRNIKKREGFTYRNPNDLSK